MLVTAGATFLLAAAGCGPKVTKRACMGGAADNPLVADAAMVRLDVYGAEAHCADGSTLAAGAGAPILSHSYTQGQPISLDVPPGPHALVLSTFADADGTQLLGIGCTEANLSAGSQICFDLTIEPGPDGGPDLSGAVCSTNPDDCPAGSYCTGLVCAPGCKADGDCAKNDAGLGVCDKTTHTCENCSANSDCGSAPGATCCNKHCVNVKTDPLNCGSCGGLCTGGATSCCNGACSNPATDAQNCGSCGNACSTLNAMTTTCAAATCSWMCNAGFAHCLAGNSGCDTNLAGAGEKLCGSVCVAAASCCSSTECMSPPAPAACYNTAGTCSGVGGSCSYTLKAGSKVCNGTTCCNAVNGTCNSNCTLTCTAGFADCDGNPSNGCEVNLASAGKKLCNGACIAIASCCTSADCMTPPNPAACYATAGSCPAAGGTCQYTENSGSQICNSNTTCCNAIHGTCNATCGLSCSPGFLDCDNNPSDGCETGCAPAHGTGACSAGSCAIGSCTSGFFDCNGSVGDGCECGTSCCTNPTTAMPGCLTTHSNGQGGTYSDCYALGTPGNPATYDPNMALDAANSDTGQAGTATTGWTCGSNNSTVTSVCKSVDLSGNTGTCTCWAYAAGSDPAAQAVVGHTFANTGNKGCRCQLATDPSWN